MAMTTKEKRKSKMKEGRKKPTMTADEIRSQIGDSQKEIVVELADATLQGTLEEISAKLKRYVASSEIEGPWRVGRRSFTRGTGYRRHSVTKFAIIGYRPYTDEELLKVGPKIVQRIEEARKREEEARKRKRLQLEQLAIDLGVKIED